LRSLHSEQRCEYSGDNNDDTKNAQSPRHAGSGRDGQKYGTNGNTYGGDDKECSGRSQHLPELKQNRRTCDTDGANDYDDQPEGRSE
jgi:hypothetical protein